jgi:hypothetical protein
MAPLPENNTNRLFVDYEGDFGTRQMQFRVNDGIAPAEAVTRVSIFLADSVAPYWFPAVSVTGMRWQAANALFSLPVGNPSVPGEGTGTQDPRDYPRFVSVGGRGITSGRRVRLTVFGIAVGVSNNYRLENAETPVVNAILAGLASLTTLGCWRTIANDNPVNYGYLNAGYNSYHQRKARRS